MFITIVTAVYIIVAINLFIVFLFLLKDKKLKDGKEKSADYITRLIVVFCAADFISLLGFVTVFAPHG